jgi:radical SAM superfamily enzyme YgiQ (UPF0313 family)
VAVFLSTIVGFPGETEEEARQTYDFIQYHIDDVFGYQFNAFVLARNSPVWRDPERWGIRMRNKPENDLQLYWTDDFDIAGGMSFSRYARMAEVFRRRLSRIRMPLFMDVPGFEAMFDARALLYIERYGIDAIRRNCAQPSVSAPG